MAKPFSLDVILSEFTDEDEAWILQDRESQAYLRIPDPRFPAEYPFDFS